MTDHPVRSAGQRRGMAVAGMESARTGFADFTEAGGERPTPLLLPTRPVIRDSAP